MAIGCHQRASLDHLHAETQLVAQDGSKPWNSVLSVSNERFLSKPPLFPIIFQSTNQDPKKHTISSCHISYVRLYLTDSALDPLEYDNIRNILHPQNVQSTIQNQAPNTIPQEMPPLVYPEENKNLQGAYITAHSQ